MRDRVGEPRVAVLVPAGGVGARLDRRTPQQFLRVAAEASLTRTPRHFRRHPAARATVVAPPAGRLARARRLVRREGGERVEVVSGGATRQESVWNALKAAPSDADIVLVHDAVRPFIDRRLVDAVVTAAVEHGAAICALPIAET